MLRRGIRALCLAVVVAMTGASQAAADTLLGSSGGLDYIRDFTVTVGGGRASANIDCAAADDPVGGGISPSGGSTAGSHVTESFPRQGAGWGADFVNDSGLNLYAAVFGVCSGLDIKKARGDASLHPGEPAVVKAHCRRGTHVTGGGGRFLDPDFIATPSWMVSSYPFDDHDHGKVPDDGWAVRFYNPSTQGDDVIASALCASIKQQRLKYRSTPTATFSYQADCPNGTSVTGGGIKHRAGDASQAWVNTTRPVDTVDDEDSVPENAWQALGRDLSTVKRVFAVCLD